MHCPQNGFIVGACEWVCRVKMRLESELLTGHQLFEVLLFETRNKTQ